MLGYRRGTGPSATDAGLIRREDSDGKTLSTPRRFVKPMSFATAAVVAVAAGWLVGRAPPGLPDPHPGRERSEAGVIVEAIPVARATDPEEDRTKATSSNAGIAESAGIDAAEVLDRIYGALKGRRDDERIIVEHLLPSLAKEAKPIPGSDMSIDHPDGTLAYVMRSLATTAKGLTQNMLMTPRGLIVSVNASDDLGRRGVIRTLLYGEKGGQPDRVRMDIKACLPGINGDPEWSSRDLETRDHDLTTASQWTRLFPGFFSATNP